MNVKRATELLESLLPILDSVYDNYGSESRTTFLDKADTYIRTVFSMDDNAQTRFIERLQQIRWYPIYTVAGSGVSPAHRNIWNNAVVSSKSLVSSMIEFVQLLHEQGKYGDEEPSSNALKEKGSRIFVVHGHDNNMKQEVALFLYELELRPIILAAEPNGGFKSVMEKFESHAGEASFAIVLLSPDDVGYAKRDGAGKAKSRARQNVILELGYFLGKLGRNNVMAFTKMDENNEPIEQPSDIIGGVIEPFEGNWQERIRKELGKAGYPIS